MPDSSLELAVLIVCYNGRKYLEDCLSSVLNSNDGPLRRHVIVVDNASTDDSAAYVAEHFPQVRLVRSPANLGFAGGNNLGWDYIRCAHPNVAYVALLNQDTIVQNGWLRPLADYLESHPTTAAAQVKLMLHPNTTAFNSAGNRSHFLGFGFTTAYGQPDHGQFDQPRLIDFPSGAACLLRTATLRQLGLFDEMLFAYLEDAEMGWRLRQAGWDIAYVPASVVYHKYAFRKNLGFYYHLERNRWWNLLVYYKAPTLALLFPALLLMELGQLFFAWRNGVLDQKWRSCAFFLNPGNVSRLRAHRRQARSRRKLTDRQFAGQFTGQIDFVEVDGWLIKRVANPLLNTYWQVARRLMFW